jgi:hypothetical protein
MAYAKLIDGNLSFAPNPILYNGYRIGNPPQEIYLDEGYKPVQYAIQPEPPGVGRWVETWTETENAIVQGWTWHEATDEDEISDTEALELLTGGESG